MICSASDRLKGAFGVTEASAVAPLDPATLLAARGSYEGNGRTVENGHTSQTSPLRSGTGTGKTHSVSRV